jgi:hypothetical protein
MLYSILITAETVENSTPLDPTVFASLVHSVGQGLRLHITEVKITKVLSSHVSTFRGPRKARVTAKPTTPSHSPE